MICFILVVYDMKSDHWYNGPSYYCTILSSIVSPPDLSYLITVHDFLCVKNLTSGLKLHSLESNYIVNWRKIFYFTQCFGTRGVNILGSLKRKYATAELDDDKGDDLTEIMSSYSTEGSDMFPPSEVCSTK